MSKEAGVAPRERELDLSKPLHVFCAELRQLRKQAGEPAYLEMQRKSGISRTALAEAVGGDHLAAWRTVEGFVLACGGDPDEWLQRYERLQEQLRTETGASNGNGQRSNGRETPAVIPDNVSSSRRPRWLWPAITVFLVVVTAVTVHMVDRVMLPTQASTPAKPAVLAVVVVQNMVARGGDELIEDSTPVYLSSKPEPYCRLNGCMVPGYTWNSGVALVVDCRMSGTTMYNYDLDSAPVQSNPYKAKSNLWYHVVLPDKTNGFISEVYIAPAYRGGLGLPVCKTGRNPTPATAS